jgi:hypothetical protein
MSSPIDGLPDRYRDYLPPEPEVPEDVPGEKADAYRAIRAIIHWAQENTSDSDEVIAQKVFEAVRMGELSAKFGFPDSADFFPN